MSNSFGEGYATRSDEEGFGGTYGGNQSKSKIQMDKEINENHPGEFEAWIMVVPINISSNN